MKNFLALSAFAVSVAMTGQMANSGPISKCVNHGEKVVLMSSMKMGKAPEPECEINAVNGVKTIHGPKFGLVQHFDSNVGDSRIQKAGYANCVNRTIPLTVIEYQATTDASRTGTERFTLVIEYADGSVQKEQVKIHLTGLDATDPSEQQLRKQTCS